MNFEVIHVSRGHMILRSEEKRLRVLGEALIASAPADPSYIIYLNSFHNWEVPPDVALTEIEKLEVINEIQKYFDERGSVVEFE